MKMRNEALPAMPRLQSGKIDRKVLKSQPLSAAAPAEAGPDNLIGRIGGDEFAVALKDCAHTEAALQRLEGLRQSLVSAGRHDGVETAILSTCNRTEIYCAASTPALDHTLDWLARSGGVSPEVLRSHSYVLEEGLAARHAFRVASGLDSTLFAHLR